MQFALRALVHWWRVTAHLYEEQVFIGVDAVNKPAVTLFCRAALSSGQRSLP